MNFRSFSSSSAKKIAVLALVAGFLAACSTSMNLISPKKPKYSPRVVKLGEPVPKGGGVFKVGQPYKILGQWFTPVDDPYYDKRGIASWYGEEFHGRRTANGEVYDMYALSAAHPTMALPSYAEVTNIRNGRSIIVRVNDRGPYKHNRIIDLSKKASEVLGFYRQGTTPVRVRYVGRAPLNGDDRYEQMALQRQPWYRSHLSFNRNRATWRNGRLSTGSNRKLPPMNGRYSFQ